MIESTPDGQTAIRWRLRGDTGDSSRLWSSLCRLRFGTKATLRRRCRAQQWPKPQLKCSCSVNRVIRGEPISGHEFRNAICDFKGQLPCNCSIGIRHEDGRPRRVIGGCEGEMRPQPGILISSDADRLGILNRVSYGPGRCIVSVKPPRSHRFQRSEFRSADGCNHRSLGRDSSPRNCAPAVPRRLRTTPEIASFEHKFGRGPGI